MTEALDDVLERCLGLFEEGASGSCSVWHTPTLATLDLSGMPQQRMVVLRRFERSERLAEIHTDRRSAKWKELRVSPSASLHVWDTSRGMQVRATGVTELHTSDSISEAAWHRLTPQMKSIYRVSPGPSASIASPDQVTERPEGLSRDDFCVIRLNIRSLEWLLLERGRHRRARFTWSASSCQSVWLVP